jgi:hypothetical protein
MQSAINSLINFKDDFISISVLGICYILAEKLSTNEKITFCSNHIYMETFFGITEKFIQFAPEYDIEIELILLILKELIGDSIERISNKTLENVVDVTLKSMEALKIHQQIQKIALLILSSEHILREISFDRYKCLRLLMDSLVTIKDWRLNYYALVVCSEIATEESITRVINLCSNCVYLETYLNIVENFVQLAPDYDSIMEFSFLIFGKLFHRLKKKLDIKTIENVVNVTIKYMELFSNYQIIQTIALSILYYSEISQIVPFDRYKCIKLVMDALVNFKDTKINVSAVLISSILSIKLSITEKSNVGSNPVYIERLLDFVRSGIQILSDHNLLFDFTLNLLSSLTDESPKTCEMFVEKGGMDLYLLVLKVRSNQSIFNDFENFSIEYYILIFTIQEIHW